jgi:hypothetical protein
MDRDNCTGCPTKEASTPGVPSKYSTLPEEPARSTPVKFKVRATSARAGSVEKAAKTKLSEIDLSAVTIGMLRRLLQRLVSLRRCRRQQGTRVEGETKRLADERCRELW